MTPAVRARTGIKNLTAEDPEDAKEEKSFTAKGAKDAKE
jgi:hypothetical protein